jgi:hypothetical protein
MSETFTGKEVVLSQLDWDQVHEAVQAQLASLADQVGKRLPAVRSEPGRTTARSWFLYSYREFLWPDEGEGKTEAVVVGVTFAAGKRHNDIGVKGDISGGESGHVYHEVGERQVPASRDGLVRAAREIAGELSQEPETVITALHERRPPPDYRTGTLLNP